MRTRAVSSSPRAHSILLTCRCTSSVREARKPLQDNNHGQTASHLCQEFWKPPSASRLRSRALPNGRVACSGLGSLARRLAPLLRAGVGIGMLGALLGLLRDHLRLLLRVVASCGPLLGQQFRTRGDVSRLSLVVMVIGRRRLVNRYIPSVRRGSPDRPGALQTMADRTRPGRAFGRRGQAREHPVHPGGGSRRLGRSIYTPSCACAVRLTSSASSPVACSGREGGGQPAQGVLETIAWHQGEGHLLQDRLVRYLAPVVGQRHLGRVRALRLQLPRPLPAGRFRADGSGLPGESWVLVVAGDVVVRLVVTAHLVACHGEDLARAGDALRLVTTIQLWFSVIS